MTGDTRIVKLARLARDVQADGADLEIVLLAIVSAGATMAECVEVIGDLVPPSCGGVQLLVESSLLWDEG